MAGQGARLTLTAELIKNLAQFIRAGLTNKSSCDACGISETTFYRWLETGEKDKDRQKASIYREFWEAIKKAEASHKMELLNTIRKAGKDGNWQAAAWELERRYYNEFGRTRVELTGAEGREIEVKSSVQIYLPDNGRTPAKKRKPRG